MKKLVAFICVVLMCVLTLSGCIRGQYNIKGLSRILSIVIDETQAKEYVGELDGYRVFVEKLKLDALHFGTIKGEAVSLQDAIEKELTSLEDWKKGAFRIQKEGETEILKYENYEVVIAYGDCLIRPLTK